MLYQSALLVGLGVENWVSLTMLAVENVTVSGLRKIRPVVSVFVSRWFFFFKVNLQCEIIERELL